MKELIDQINAQATDFAKNAAAFVEKGNRAAGVRARKNTLELAKLMKQFRQDSVKENK